MYYYHLSFYGQTKGQVGECMRKLMRREPLIRSCTILPRAIVTGERVRPSHTVELVFETEADRRTATHQHSAVAETYLPYAVGSKIECGHYAAELKTPKVAA